MNGGQINPDLFYNKGNVLRYLQEYNDAKLCYVQAAKIDPSFSSSLLDIIADIDSFLSRSCDLIQRNGQIKKKKWDSIMSRMMSSFQYSSHTTFSALTDSSSGENLKSLMVTVLMPITKGTTPPESFLCVDTEGKCGMISIYNIGANSAIFNNSSDSHIITISNPTVKVIVFEDKMPLFVAQVRNIQSIIVDGRSSINNKSVVGPKLAVNVLES